MFFGIILLAILFFFCVVIAFTFTYIIRGILPYKDGGITTLPASEQWFLKAVVYYPSLVVLMLIPVLFTDLPQTTSYTGTAIFAGCHMLLAAAGAAVSLYMRPQHKGYTAMYIINIILSSIFSLFGLVAIFRFD